MRCRGLRGLGLAALLAACGGDERADPQQPAPAPEGCGGIDYAGACDGALALFCHEEALHTVDCGAEGCGWVDDETGYYCGGEGERPAPAVPEPAEPDDEEPPPVEDPAPPEPEVPPAEEETAPCAALGERGACEGDVAVWCDAEGRIRRDDCAAVGERCGWVSDAVGHYCGGRPDGAPEGDEQPEEPPDPEASPEREAPPEPCDVPAEALVAELGNAARAAANLPALRCDGRMARAARQHSEDMCAGGYLEHRALDGSEPRERLERAGVVLRLAGENIARGYRSPESVHEAWMASPAHRANLLGPGWSRTGVGFAACDGEPYWTQVFVD